MKGEKRQKVKDIPHVAVARLYFPERYNCLLNTTQLKSSSQLYSFGSLMLSINPQNFCRIGTFAKLLNILSSGQSCGGRKHARKLFQQRGQNGWTAGSGCEDPRNPRIEETIHVSCIETSRKFHVVNRTIPPRIICLVCPCSKVGLIGIMFNK